MAQTYAQFKEYVTRFIWRENDAALAADLDKIVRMADAELNRLLDLQRREVSTTISPQSGDYSLPSDFYQMISLTNLQPNRQTRAGEMRNTSKSMIAELRAQTDSRYIQPFYYVQRGASTNTLFLVGPFSADNPGSFDLTYRTAVPDFEAEDASWLEADYLDLYTYAVLKHVAVFLREDERVQLYSGYLQQAVASALDEDKRLVRFGGSPLNMQPNRFVPRTRRT